MNEEEQKQLVVVGKLLLRSVPYWDNGYILSQALERHYVKTIAELTGKTLEQVRLEVHNNVLEIQSEMKEEIGLQKEIKEILKTIDNNK